MLIASADSKESAEEFGVRGDNNHGSSVQEQAVTPRSALIKVPPYAASDKYSFSLHKKRSEVFIEKRGYTPTGFDEASYNNLDEPQATTGLQVLHDIPMQRIIGTPVNRITEESIFG